MVEDRAGGRGQPKHIIKQDMLRSENQGIPDADIILKVQCWLDMVKERNIKVSKI